MKNKDNGGLKVKRISIPKPKQRGWKLMDIQGNELVYIRRRWNKTITLLQPRGGKKLKMEKQRRMVDVLIDEIEAGGYSKSELQEIIKVCEKEIKGMER